MPGRRRGGLSFASGRVRRGSSPRYTPLGAGRGGRASGLHFGGPRFRGPGWFRGRGPLFLLAAALILLLAAGGVLFSGCPEGLSDRRAASPASASRAESGAAEETGEKAAETSGLPGVEESKSASGEKESEAAAGAEESEAAAGEEEGENETAADAEESEAALGAEESEAAAGTGESEAAADAEESGAVLGAEESGSAPGAEEAGASEPASGGTASGADERDAASDGREAASEETESAAARPVKESKAAEPEETAGSAAPSYSAVDFGPGDRVSGEALSQIGTDAFFTQEEINDAVFARMYGNSYKADCIIPRSELRYIRVLYYDFNGDRRVGELVSSRQISQDLVEIFRELYRNRYPIEKIRLVDDYGADDDRSSSDNNTSCFNYRTVAGRSSLSLHARGLAIDINPLYNPYVRYDEDGTALEVMPAGGSDYVDRSRTFSYKIDETDLCYRLFTERGFTWGGSWTSEPDYMHFSRGAVPET